MTPEQEQLLIDRYPNLFDPDHRPWSRTTGFTLQVSAAGWFELIDALCQRLSAAGGCKVTEIREKVGELRVTCEGETDEIRYEIDLAQEESRRTCEVCGGYGQLRVLPEALMATLCDACEQQLIHKLNPTR